MSVSLVTTPSRPLAGQADRLLWVELCDAPGAVVRVLALLQRRRCTLTRVDFRAGDRHRPGRLIIGLAAPRAHADRVGRWLAALVDVLSVEVLDP